jgi:hypothetical protein
MTKMATQIETLGGQPATPKGVLFRLQKGDSLDDLEKSDGKSQFDAVMALPPGPVKSAAILALRGA